MKDNPKGPLDDEIRAFEELKKQGKLKHLDGKYVAIYQQKLVGIADSINELSLNFYQKYGYKYVLMRKVGEEPVDYSFLRRPVF